MKKNIQEYLALLKQGEYSYLLVLKLIVIRIFMAISRKIGGNHDNNLLNWFYNRKHNTIRRFLHREFGYIIDQYIGSEIKIELDERDKKYESSVWVMWWQGEEQMPAIIKQTFESIKHFAGQHPVVLIDKTNFKDYIDIPSSVLNKLDDGRIKIQFFSDIIRTSLLAKYGGLWLDATMWVTSPISDSFFENPFYSIVRGGVIEQRFASKERYTGFCMGSNGDTAIFHNWRDLLIAYATKYSCVIDYFMIDYMMDLMLFYNSEYARIVSNIDTNNVGVHFFIDKYNMKFNEVEYKKAINKTSLFKMTFKGELNEKTPQGNTTFYGHILNCKIGAND